MDIKRLHLLDIIEATDLNFFIIVAKKNIKFIVSASALIAIIVLLASFNMEKKYLSEATIVIEPEESQIVNINEAYSSFDIAKRVNNIIATLKSDEVMSYIVDDEENELEFKALYGL